jgi:hypothetical protein
LTGAAVPGYARAHVDGDAGARPIEPQARDPDLERRPLERLDPNGSPKLVLMPELASTASLLWQAERVVGALVTDEDGSRLESLGESWTVAVQMTRRGWQAQFIRDGAAHSLQYNPTFVRPGGVFRLGGERYTLRVPLFGGIWSLRDGAGEPIAKLRELTNSPLINVDLRLTRAAAVPVVPLVLASCWVIAREWHFKPLSN